ncbi:MAG TPA: hypothetical protein PKD85_03370 [Saprospiraceae bacterium]|nr:hypothetical protein [Saprospiraceae bacterium]
MVVREITIIKCPRNDRPEDKPISFPPLQNLHLHLMENKKKLKKGLPLVQIKKQPVKPETLNIKPYSDDMMSGKTRVNIKSKGVEITKKKSGGEKGAKEEKAGKVVKGEKEADDEDSKSPKSSKDSKKSKKKKNKEEDEEEPEEEDNIEDELGDEEPDEEEDEDEEIVKDIDEEEDDEVAKELGDKEEDEPVKEADPADGEPPGPEEEDIYAGLSPEERELQEKEEYIWRFKIMKKKYRNREIPDFNEHDDLDVMKTTYERKLKEISLDENVDSYRTYLIIGFHGMEFVCKEWLGLPEFEGYADQQQAAMDKYDTLLIELGEKSRSRWFSSLPVELRLLGFIIIQAGLFYLGKIMSKKAGSSIAGFFNALSGQPTPVTTEEPTEAPKKKMRGPSVKVDSLKKKD